MKILELGIAMSKEQDKLPPTLLLPMYDEIIKKIMREALLSYYNEEIQANYYIHDWAQMPDGDWVIRLKRTFESWKREREDD